MDLIQKLKADHAAAVDKIQAVITAEDSSVTTAELDAMADEAAGIRTRLEAAERAAELQHVEQRNSDINEGVEWARDRGVAAADPGAPPPKTFADELRELGLAAHAGKPAGVLQLNLAEQRRRVQLREEGLTGRDVALAHETGSLAASGIPLKLDVDTSTTAGAKAGNLIPSLFATTVYDYMQFLGGLRRAGAFVSSSDSGASQTFFRVDAHYDASSGGETAEKAKVAETDDTYGRYDIPVYAYTGSAVASKESLQDISVDIEALINEAIARTIGWKTENRFHSGSGTSQPTGLLTDSNVGSVTASTAVANGTAQFTADALLDVMFGLDANYIMDAGSTAWLLNPTGYAEVLKLKDGDNRPLFEPARYLGEPDTIQGRRVVYDAFVPVAKSGVASVAAVFGSIRDAYHIRDAQSIEISASAHVLFQNRQVVFLGDARAGGTVRDHRAVRFFKTKKS